MFISSFTRWDDYMTPKSAWEDIAHLIPKDKVIWEPFYGDGKSGEYLEELGFEVVHLSEDFFENDKGDVVVTNPPFSKTKAVFARLKKLDKPFVVLCPAARLFTKYFRDMFKDEIQVIVPPQRIHFSKLKDGEIDTSKNRCPFNCFYYCWKMDLDKDITWL
jgi:hypothetical protein